MKDIAECSNSDLFTCVEQAEKIAIGTISNIYHDLKDETEASSVDMQKIKEAMQVLELAKCLRTAIVTE